MIVANFYEELETTIVNIPWEQEVSVLLLVFHTLSICPSHHSRHACRLFFQPPKTINSSHIFASTTSYIKGSHAVGKASVYFRLS